MTNTQSNHQLIRDQAIAWLLRMREASGNGETQQAFSAWLAVDPEHGIAYQQVEQQWAWMEQFKSQPLRARDEALHYRPHKPAWRKAVQLSAAAAVLLGVGLAVFSPQGLYGIPYNYNVGKGQRQTVALSDGSSIELNTDTQVRVRFNRSRRQVELIRGEAFFNVAHNAERPFTVVAGNLNIRDIGTAFNVYQQAEQINIAVQEGEVEIKSQGGLRRLTTGQQLAYRNDGGFVAVTEYDAAATAWRQGQLLFRGRRLAEVLAEIGRYHDVRIRLPDPKLAELRVNGSFRTEQLDNMLNAVATLLPVKVRHTGEQEIVLEAVSDKH